MNFKESNDPTTILTSRSYIHKHIHSYIRIFTDFMTQYEIMFSELVGSQGISRYTGVEV